MLIANETLHELSYTLTKRANYRGEIPRIEAKHRSM